MGDDRMLRYENAGEGNISSPDIMRELGVEDQQLLFERLLPDLMSDFSPQNGGPFTLEFSRSVSIMEEVSRIYIQRRTSRRDMDHQSNSRNLSIGDYTIDLEVEWAAVMKVLIIILLERTLDVLYCLKRIARASLHKTQVSMLQATEQKVKKVALNMQSGEAAGHGSQSIR